MQTVVIWDTLGEEDIKFFVVDSDVRHLHHKYINSVDISDEEAEQVSLLVYNQEGTERVIQMTEEFPVDAVKAGAAVIVCGFLP